VSHVTAQDPDVVINASAMVGVGPCSSYPLKAFAINTKAVKDLAEICDQMDVCLVHLSTDGVFDGRKDDYYTEDNSPNPLNVYGVTKYMGEIFIKNICKKYYIFRIPILFGMRENQRTSFLENMYNSVLSGQKELNIADDEISCPSYSDDLARGILMLIESGREYGLYHLKNEGVASLYEFSRTFFQKVGLDIIIRRAKASDLFEKDRDLKPLNTSIRSVKIEHLRDWRDAMDDYVMQLKNKTGQRI